MSKEQTPIKNLEYYKSNAEEDYIKTPISVLRYISELENNTQAKVLEALESVDKYITTPIHTSKGVGGEFKIYPKIYEIRQAIADMKTEVKPKYELRKD